MTSKELNTLSRWLHNYLSMFSYAALLFFSVTGITLNHPDWFTGEPETQRLTGELDPNWIAGIDTLPDARLQIVEHLRNTHGIGAALADFLVDDYEFSVSFRGPGYIADAFIERSDATYVLSVTEAGSVALLNDLHKGRDTGTIWAGVIDFSAILMIFVSITGFIMIFFIKKRKAGGLVLALVGTVLLVFFYYAFV